METKGDETPGGGTPAERLCVVCNAPLATYNTGDRCFRHGAEEADDTDEIRTLIERASARGAFRKTAQQRKRLGLGILLATKRPSGPAEPLPPSSAPLPLPGDAECVLGAVEARFDCPSEELLGPRRTQPLAEIRHVAIYLLRQDFAWTFQKIGELFRRGHQPIIHSCRKIQDALDRDENLRSAIEEIRGRYRKEEASQAGEVTEEKPNQRWPLTATETVVLRQVSRSQEVSRSQANEEKPRPRTKRRTKPPSRRKEKMKARAKEGAMTVKTLADVIRDAAQRWVAQASIDELAAIIPASLLTNSTGEAPRRYRKQRRAAKRGEAESAKSATFWKRRSPHAKRKLTPAEGEMIRKRLAGEHPGTPEWKKLRQELCLKLSITDHQITGALGGRRKHKS